jgi:hypothetical protein
MEEVSAKLLYLRLASTQLGYFLSTGGSQARSVVLPPLITVKGGIVCKRGWSASGQK